METTDVHRRLHRLAKRDMWASVLGLIVHLGGLAFYSFFLSFMDRYRYSVGDTIVQVTAWVTTIHRVTVLLFAIGFLVAVKKVNMDHARIMKWTNVWIIVTAIVILSEVVTMAWGIYKWQYYLYVHIVPIIYNLVAIVFVCRVRRGIKAQDVEREERKNGDQII